MGRDVGVGLERREDGGGGKAVLTAHGQGFEQGGGLRAAFADGVLSRAVLPQPEGAPFAGVVQLAPLIDGGTLGVGDIGGEIVHAAGQQGLKLGRDDRGGRLQRLQPGKEGAVVERDGGQAGVVEQERLLLRGGLEPGVDLQSLVEAVERGGVDCAAQGGDMAAHMVAQGLGMAADDGGGMVQLGLKGRGQAVAGRGDLEGVAIDVGGGAGRADLFQHGRLAEQGGEVIGLDGQGIVQGCQRAGQVTEHAQGQRPVQEAVVGRPHPVGLIDQAEGGLRIVARQGLAGLLQQCVLSACARLVHAGAPGVDVMTSV